MIYSLGMTSFLLAVAAVAATVTAARRPLGALVEGGRNPAVAAALARVEGWRLLRHPLVLAGVSGAVLGFPYGGNEDWQFRWGMTGVYLYAIAMAGMVVVHLAISRDRRGDTDELAATLPTGMRTRVAGHARSLAWLLLPVGLLWVGVVVVRLGPDLSHPMADGGVAFVWQPSLLELAQGPVAVAVYLLVALAAGVWWRHSAVGVALPLLLMFSPLVWMFTMVVDLTVTVPYQSGRLVEIAGIHTVGQYLFLAGVAAVAASGALLRYGPRRRWGWTAAAATVVTLVGAALRVHEGLL
jgi:hypothetical protein